MVLQNHQYDYVFDWTLLKQKTASLPGATASQQQAVGTVGTTAANTALHWSEGSSLFLWLGGKTRNLFVAVDMEAWFLWLFRALLTHNFLAFAGEEPLRLPRFYRRIWLLLHLTAIIENSKQPNEISTFCPLIVREIRKSDECYYLSYWLFSFSFPLHSFCLSSFVQQPENGDENWRSVVFFRFASVTPLFFFWLLSLLENSWWTATFWLIQWLLWVLQEPERSRSPCWVLDGSPGSRPFHSVFCGWRSCFFCYTTL